MAKIAVKIEPPPSRGVSDAGARSLNSHVLARGDDWSVADVVCTAGPRDRAFEEQHSTVNIAMVVGGSFQYRSSAGRELMTPGCLFLGNEGQHFECGHEHGVGDRCISFSYKRQYFERLVAETGTRSRKARFSMLRLPPMRELSSLIARACAALPESARGNGRYNALNAWEEISIELAVQALEAGNGGKPNPGTLPAAEARMTRVVRRIDSCPEAQHGLGALAAEAKLSRYHFLRMFQQITGITPHQYVLRARLRNAAMRLVQHHSSVLGVALDSGFGDISNFNHAFRAEFGVSPRVFRNRYR